MAELICRSLRDGSIEGEHAPTLTIKDSLLSPSGTHAFNYFLCSLAANAIAAKSQARGLVFVVFSESPLFYINLLKSKGLDASLAVKHLRILDCYSDPLGWKEKIRRAGDLEKPSVMESDHVCRDVKDIAKIFSLILELGKGFAEEGKARFAVAIDSVSAMLRHSSLQSVASLISNLRSHDQVSCMLWLLHADLHELRATAAFEYISTIVASLEPMLQFSDRQRGSENIFWLGKNYRKGRFHVCLKHRNGRVKLLNEVFHMQQAGIAFSSPSSGNMTLTSNLPKLQFNLQLSEKEQDDRARVVLPFEHQGNGEPIQIYDGRRSLTEDKRVSSGLQPVLPMENKAQRDKVKGEIHYIRDSDDEQPDSDEDPDDDLDI